MKTTSGVMPQNVVKYVAMGTKLINLVLLICHIGFGILFWLYDAHVLFAYNCVNSLAFLFACIMLHKKKKWTYIITIYLGIFIFMILAVLYLGWDYGFQQYCIGFVASFVFTDFYMSRERKFSRFTKFIVAFDIILYVGLRLWTYEHPYIYFIDNKSLVSFFYISNSLIGFSFLIMYLCIYSSTVHRLENSLTEMANLDPLTGISNRRKMQQMLKYVMEEYETQQYQTVIAMIDIDYFKKINDTYGHDAGDEVLVMLAKILRDKHEENESFHVSRWGGEEFLVFYERHQKSREEVIQEFDALRQKIQDTVIQYNQSNINITVTIGLAFYEKGETIHSLIKVADKNLYEGKNAGRNRVVS
ncbi:MAG: GGDEF domain-containing protein [Lachnospiraceae bacterium]|nr:GGDEF domain-containing protein [Lachnospiraceae bacterium]